MRAKRMNRHSRKQHGAILALMAILIIVLIGIGALALDLGRLFVQRTELQNAADAAALAAAAELDGGSDAKDRAKAAARQLLSSDQYNRGIYFGQFTPDDDLPDDAFKFYSTISADPAPRKLPEDGTASSEEARFVEVTIDLTEKEEGEKLGEEPGEMVPLYFLPVLGLLPGVDADMEAGTRAVALAGVENVPCYEPSMFMCVADKNDLQIDVGEGLRIRVHGGKASDWTAGNFGFLLPSTSKSGAPDLQHFLGNAGNEECLSGAEYVARTGQIAQKSKQGVNTRFDVYEGGVTPAKYPPAPNIINYGYRDKTDPATNYRDLGLGTDPDADSYRIGSGDWNRDGYWATYHSNIPYDPTNPLLDGDGNPVLDGDGNPVLDPIDDRPPGWKTMTHWQTYLWELGLDDDMLPNGSPNMPVDVSNWNLDDDPPSYTNPDPACDPDSTSAPLNHCHGEPDPENFYCRSVDGEFDPVCKALYDAIYRDPDADKAKPSVPYRNDAAGSPKSQTDLRRPVTHASRRVVYLAALECETLGLTGAWDENDADVLKDGKILQFLLTEYAANPDGDQDKFEIFGEYIGPTEEGAGLTRRVIQLYE